MSFETDVPMNDVVVGKRYRFYFNRGSLKNPVHATVIGMQNNSIGINNVVDTITDAIMHGSYSYPVDWVDRVTSNNIGPSGTGLNKLIGEYLGGRKRRSRRNKRTRSSKKRRRTRRY